MNNQPYAIGQYIRKKETGEELKIMDIEENTDTDNLHLGSVYYMVDPPVANGVYHAEIGPAADQPYDLIEGKSDPLVIIRD